MQHDDQPVLEPDDLIPTRHSLLSRLKNWDDSESWNDFFRTYWKLIFRAARKAGLNEAESQDVVQQTIIYVSRRISEFKYNRKRGSFKGWLLQITYWRINDQFRNRLILTPDESPPSASDDDTDLFDRLPDPAGSLLEQAWDAEWEKNLFDAAVERVKRKVNPKQYQVFDAYVFQEWPAEKVQTVLNVNLGQIKMIKSRISKSIKKEMKYLETHLL